jgi:peptide/nickel transport system ATP-binding protein
MKVLLKVEGLHVAYVSRTGTRVPALAGVSLEVAPGETLGMLGESGCGKSTLAAALARLLPRNAAVEKGSIWFEGSDLLKADGTELRKIRGRRMAMVFQEPSLALHPAIRVGKQVSDVLAAHENLSSTALREKTQEVLAEVFPDERERIADSYPHQLSGGQQQRVLIAQAIACGPSMIVADEPTAALDATTQREILELFRKLREERKLAMIFITHNPWLLSGFADRVLVLYAGKTAEIGPTEKVLSAPLHPYTRALLESIPGPGKQGFGEKAAKHRLPVIGGEPPNLGALAKGCRFEPRCAMRMEMCVQREPAEVAPEPKHEVSCFKYGG